MSKIKDLSYNQLGNLGDLIDYRNKMLLKARARTKTFKDNEKNYYWYRIQEIDNVINYNTDMKLNNKIGLIKLKGSK